MSMTGWTCPADHPAPRPGAGQCPACPGVDLHGPTCACCKARWEHEDGVWVLVSHGNLERRQLSRAASVYRLGGVAGTSLEVAAP